MVLEKKRRSHQKRGGRQGPAIVQFDIVRLVRDSIKGTAENRASGIKHRRKSENRGWCLGTPSAEDSRRGSLQRVRRSEGGKTMAGGRTVSGCFGRRLSTGHCDGSTGVELAGEGGRNLRANAAGWPQREKEISVNLVCPRNRRVKGIQRVGSKSRKGDYTSREQQRSSSSQGEEGPRVRGGGCEKRNGSKQSLGKRGLRL